MSLEQTKRTRPQYVFSMLGPYYTLIMTFSDRLTFTYKYENILAYFTVGIRDEI